MIRLPMVPTVADNTEKQTGLKLPTDLYRRVRVAAAERDMSIKAFVAHALAEYIALKNKQQAA